jgi:hypothetical protein
MQGLPFRQHENSIQLRANCAPDTCENPRGRAGCLVGVI